jgi:integrase/recombinase XerD
MKALLAAPDRSRCAGQRDQVMFALAYNTGARVSELINIRVQDVQLDATPASVCLHGKGRKQRTIPLWRETAARVHNWVKARALKPEQPLFSNRFGNRMTRAAVADRMALAVKAATERCPQLRGRHITCHTIRHATAMHLLQAGVDTTVIALWLGHESPVTTHGYVEADLRMKERALKAVRARPFAPAALKPRTTCCDSSKASEIMSGCLRLLFSAAASTTGARGPQLGTLT